MKNQTDLPLEHNCPYAKVILERYKDYDGRIGYYCDMCKGNCKHSAIKMSQFNLTKIYAFMALKWKEDN